MWSKGGVRVKGQREKVNVSNSLTLKTCESREYTEPVLALRGASSSCNPAL